ncbi:F-box/LRR-repeat protein [Spatholobus suberectus]|nr:F-box/LRR-repeat protein [Spatholobus suberectus]
MVFPKEQPGALRECIDDEPQGAGESSRNRREVGGENEVRRSSRTINIDRISELPDSVLLHIMNFMDTRDAVRTCVLSKRWKDLCKRLTSLTFYSDLPNEYVVESFAKFESWVLFSRDDSCSLLNLTIESWIKADVLDRVIQYALFHNVRRLKMNIYSSRGPNFESLPLTVRCQSLTSLELSNKLNPSALILPKSLHLPALKSLRLAYVNFTAGDNDRAEPFSNCHVLNTLVLVSCSLNKDAQVLCISSSTLSSLTIFEGKAYRIALSTPNLSSFTVTSSVRHQLSSTCNLSFLGEVNINTPWGETSWDGKTSIIVRWLQVLANVKILTIGLRAVQTILRDLSNPISTRPQPPCFVRLESLKVRKQLFGNVSDKEVSRVVEYLLQNSPTAGVDIIRIA